MRTRTDPPARASSAARARAAAAGVESGDRPDVPAREDVRVRVAPFAAPRVQLPVAVVDGAVEAVRGRIDRRQVGRRLLRGRVEVRRFP